MTAPAVPYGSIIDALGVTGSPLADGELAVQAVVVMRIVDEAGNTYTRHLWSDGMAWVDRVALTHIAHEVELDESIRKAPTSREGGDGS